MRHAHEDDEYYIIQNETVRLKFATVRNLMNKLQCEVNSEIFVL